MLKLFDELNILTTDQQTTKVPSGHYAGLQLRIAGATGTAGTEADLCNRIIINHRGQNIVRADYVTLRKLADLLYGKPTATITATAFDFQITIPFFTDGFPSALDLSENEPFSVFVEKGGVGGTPTANKAEIYGMIAEAPEWYRLKLLEGAATLTGGATPIEITERNVAGILMLKAATSDPSNIMIEVDGILKHSSDWEVAVGMTNLISKVEATALECVYFDLNPTRRIDESLSDKVSIVVTGGTAADVLTYLVVSYDFSPKRTALSSTRIQSRARARIEKKTLGGEEIKSIVRILNPELVAGPYGIKGG